MPGNHELWTTNNDPMQMFGRARYDYLVNMCDEMGVITPEHPFPVWTDQGGPATIVPMFLLYDYTFLPDGAATKAEGLAIARERNVVATDEFVLSHEPYATQEAWCRDRLADTRKRLEDLDWVTPTVLVNHFPLVREPCDAMFYPEFSLWCGTTATADWHTRYNAVCSVYGHLHIPRTTWYDGVRFEEVSVGYPREWRRRKPYRWLRQVLPDPNYPSGYLNEFGGHFVITAEMRANARENSGTHQEPAGDAGEMIVATLLSDVLPGHGSRRRDVHRPTGFGAAAGGGAADRAVGGQTPQRVRHRPLLRAVGARRTGRAAGADPQGGEGRTVLAGRRRRQPHPLRRLPWRGRRSPRHRAVCRHRRRTARRAAQRRARRDQPARRTSRINALPAGLHWDRILFCAKEATYKAWFPVTRRWLGFEDAHIVFAVDDTGTAGGFESRILIDGAALSGPPLTALRGRWSVRDGLALTAIVL